LTSALCLAECIFRGGQHFPNKSRFPWRSSDFFHHSNLRLIHPEFLSLLLGSPKLKIVRLSPTPCTTQIGSLQCSSSQSRHSQSCRPRDAAVVDRSHSVLLAMADRATFCPVSHRIQEVIVRSNDFRPKSCGMPYMQLEIGVDLRFKFIQEELRL
jgi:hypothetical protein